MSECRIEVSLIDLTSASDSESDSATDAPKRGASPDLHCSCKKARTVHAEPTNRAEAQAFLDAKLEAAALCGACMCRDKGHAAVENLFVLLASVPEFATVHTDADGAMQLRTLPIDDPEAEDEASIDLVEEVALAISEDCARIDQALYLEAHGPVLLRNRFYQTRRACDNQIVQRADSMRVYPGLVRRLIADTLAQVPDGIVDIVASYLNVTKDVVDPPFLRDVYGSYLRTIRQFLESQLVELNLLEASKDERRSFFDSRRGATFNRVHSVLSCANMLTRNHINGDQMMQIQRSLQEGAYNLFTSFSCPHSVGRANSMRAEMARNLQAVEAEQTRLQKLGFNVSIDA